MDWLGAAIRILKIIGNKMIANFHTSIQKRRKNMSVCTGAFIESEQRNYSIAEFCDFRRNTEEAALAKH